MAAHIAIVDSPDTLHLSEEAQAALRLHPGSRISITIEEGKVTLQPAEENNIGGNPPVSQTAEFLAARKREARAKVEQITEELRRPFIGQPSLEDEFFRTRDIDTW